MMRKKRGGSDGDIPVLTDVVTITASEFSLPTADIPVLNERVEDVVVVSPPRHEPPETAASMFEGDPSDWLVMDTVDPALHSVSGKAPDTLAVVPPVAMKTMEPAPDPRRQNDIPTPATHKGSPPPPATAGSAATPPARAVPAAARRRPSSPPVADRQPRPIPAGGGRSIRQRWPPSAPQPACADCGGSRRFESDEGVG